MALSKREQGLLVVTISIVTVSLGYLLFLPLWKDWRAVRSDWSKQKEQLKITRATLEREPGWRSEYADLRGAFAQEAERFERSSDVLKKIEEIGQHSGVSISQQKPLSAVEKDVYRELPVQCTVDTSIASLVKFLHGLRSGSEMMSVEQLSIVMKGSDPGVLRCDVQIKALSGKAETPSS